MSPVAIWFSILVPLPPTLLSAELDSDSITVTWKQPIDASSHKISCYVVKVRPVTADSTTIYVSYPDTGDELYKRTIENLMSDTLYEIMVASESSVGMGSFSVDHLLALTTSFGKFIVQPEKVTHLLCCWRHKALQQNTYETTYVYDYIHTVA